MSDRDMARTEVPSELRNPEIVALEYRMERLECLLQEMVDRHRVSRQIAHGDARHWSNEVFHRLGGAES
jgi:hypothetical protein